MTPSPPSLRYAWFVVFLLTLANVSSFIDRQILSLLVKPLKHDLHLSDTQVSLLLGLSFAVFYTIFGMVIGRLADRYSRRNLIIGGIAIWSLMTALCGGVRTYSQFFLARMGVGVGEATLSPSAYSIIADYFPKKRLALAMSVFTMGIFLGSGLALVVGAGLIARMPTEGLVHVPVFGDVFPWQVVFFYVGLPGLAVALLLLTVKEPPRRSLLQTHGAAANLSLAESLRLIFAHRKAYLLVCFGIACTAMVSYGLTAWVPTYFVRTFGWSVPRAGVSYGLVLVGSSIAGVLFGGWYADHLTKNGVADGRLRIGLLTSAGCLLSAFIPLIPNAQVALLALVLPSFLLAMPMGAATAAIQELMPNQVRALASSIFLFILNIVGLGLGPLLVALFTDYLFHDEGAIRYSLTLLLVVGGVLGTICFLAAMRPYRTALAANDAKTAATVPVLAGAPPHPLAASPPGEGELVGTSSTSS
jgi:MFS family permease